MKQAKRVSRRSTAAAASKRRGRVVGRSEALKGQDARLGREPKKRITLFLDADVLAWLREEPKYQTRINRVLREIVTREKEEAGQ